MGKTHISRVSKEEINELRSAGSASFSAAKNPRFEAPADDFSAEFPQSNQSLYDDAADFGYPQKKPSTTGFLKKLKQGEIESWFAPFYYIGSQIVTETDSNTEFLLVECEDFAVIMNDFDLYFEERPKQRDDTFVGAFDFIKFKEQCFHLGLTPEQALGEYVQSKFRNRFPSYSSEKAKHDERNLKKLKEDRKAIGFNKQINNLFEELEEKKKAIIELEKNKAYFGTFKPDEN